MAQMIECLPRRSGELSFAPNTHVKRTGMRAHSSNPGAEAVETVQYLGIPD